MRFARFLLAAPLALVATLTHAGDAPLFVPQWLGAQYTFVDQHQSSLHSPYAGPLSLHARSDTRRSDTFGAYFGVALPARLQFYFDVEMFKGGGVSDATGLGGLTNGDVIRAGTTGLGKSPYVARRFLRWTLPLGDATSTVERAQDQLPGTEAVRRIEVKVGKMAVGDDFDKNRYAGSTRTQFMNWTLFNDTAWDFAADTRGYTDGVMLAWVDAGWSLRYGVYRMPFHANGQRLVPSLRRARGEQTELTVQPDPDGWALRLLAFRNTASMGVYRQAIAAARASGSVPDIAADERPGQHKYGFGLNGELPLADHGDSGLFMRAGWNDGRTESFAFTEVDRTLSGGFQLSGVHWNRPGDHLGVGVAFNALSPGHREYLALGGEGFVLGDGALHYGKEQILETYYNLSIGKHLTLSPDLQLVRNPGYNRDRGPARFVALRAHLEL
ncbi:carbohydrate porin [Rhodanobacter denitrificans]|uniref:Carbohydrate porin n=1 Tax=Rhodanobacter denitrificans TaxID=666685 RepID=A0A368KG73_9GAMM|nr:carbohydrate porin [Rhodanobacter denitrificans]RCS30126.1 carbohydrate porin [Rhodanobacter denitrificans]